MTYGPPPSQQPPPGQWGGGQVPPPPPPGQWGTGQVPPPGGPPPTPWWKSKPVLAVIGGLLVLCCLGAFLNRNNATETVAPVSTVAAATTAAPAPTQAPAPAAAPATPAPTPAPAPPPTPAPTPATTRPPAPTTTDLKSHVTFTKCAINPTIGWIEAAVQVKNPGPGVGSYLITGEAVDGAGNRLMELNGAANSVAQGQTATVQLIGGDVPAGTKFTCRVANVIRTPY